MTEHSHKVELTICTFLSAKDIEGVVNKIYELAASLKDPMTNEKLVAGVTNYHIGEVVDSHYYEDEAIKYDRGDYDYLEE